jgi:hypothetical protein
MSLISTSHQSEDQVLLTLLGSSNLNRIPEFLYCMPFKVNCSTDIYFTIIGKMDFENDYIK